MKGSKRERRPSPKKSSDGAIKHETVFKLPVHISEESGSATAAPSLKSVSHEYTTKYLESLGVKPSKHVANLVKKSVPLTQECMAMHLRSQGHLNDEVQVTMPQVNHEIKPYGLVLPAKLKQAQVTHSALQKVVARQDVQPAHAPLLDICKRFLHPFSIDAAVTRRSVRKVLGLAEEIRDTTTLLEHSGHQFAGGSNPYAMAKEELATEVQVSPEVVLSLLSELESSLIAWYSAQPPELLEGRLGPEGFAAAVEVMVSERCLQMYITALNLLYQEFVCSSPLYAASPRLGSPAQASKANMGQENSNSSFIRPRKAVHRSVSIAQRPAISASESLMSRWDLGYIEAQKRKQEEANTLAKLQADHLAMIRAKPSASSQYDPIPPPMPPTNVAAAAGSVAAAAATAAAAAVDKRGFVRNSASHVSFTSRLKADRSARSLGGEVSSASEVAAPRPLSRLRTFKHSSSAAMASFSFSSVAGESTDVNRDVLQSFRLFALHRSFATLENEQSGSHTGVFFTLPIVFLAMRMLPQLFFSAVFPSWLKTTDGMGTLDCMDEALTAAFDPDGYLEGGLTALQSGTDAVAVSSRYHTYAHGGERHHFNSTGALLKAALGDAKSPEARRLIAHTGRRATGSLTSQHPGRRSGVFTATLSHEQQSELLNMRVARLGKPASRVTQSLEQKTARDEWTRKRE